MSATVGVWNAQGLEHADTALLERVRDGDCDAYGQLWRRHLPSAYAVANRYRGRACAEDIVGEASLRVYDRIRAGTGPTSNFRSYFLSTVKTVAIDLVRAELRLVPTQPDDLEDACAPAPPYNPALRVDQDLVRVAFGRLTEREQHLLWRTAVEGTPPTVLAPTMGLSANAVSVAALRARESLRGHYLDAYADRAVQRANSEECRWVLTRIGRYVRDDLRASHRSRIERHLQQCRHANVVLAELSEVNRALPALMVALLRRRFRRSGALGRHRPTRRRGSRRCSDSSLDRALRQSRGHRRNRNQWGRPGEGGRAHRGRRSWRCPHHRRPHRQRRPSPSRP